MPRTRIYPPSSGKSTRSSSKSRFVQDGFGYSFSLKVKWAILWARSSKVSVQKVSLCLFQWKPRRSGVTLESPGLQNIPQIPGKSSRSWSKSRCAQRGPSYSFSLKVKLGYILGQKLEDKRSKSFPASISLQTKAIRNKFRVHRTGKYSLISGKSSRRWSKSRCG